VVPTISRGLRSEKDYYVADGPGFDSQHLHEYPRGQDFASCFLGFCACLA
jgi:hypothetical protein